MWDNKYVKYLGNAQIKLNNTIYKKNPTGISKELGIPLIVPRNPRMGVVKNGRQGWYNPSATFLNYEADPVSRFWGVASPEWQPESKIGNVLVVRQDRKRILDQQVWALADYCQFYLADKFAKVLENSGGKKERESHDERVYH